MVSGRDSWASGIFQKSKFASNFVNVLTHESWARVSSTAGSG